MHLVPGCHLGLEAGWHQSLGVFTQHRGLDLEDVTAAEEREGRCGGGGLQVTRKGGFKSL